MRIISFVCVPSIFILMGLSIASSLLLFQITTITCDGCTDITGFVLLSFFLELAMAIGALTVASWTAKTFSFQMTQLSYLFRTVIWWAVFNLIATIAFGFYLYLLIR